MDYNHIPYQITDHTADLGILVKGHDIVSLFENAAKAVMDIVVEGPFGTQSITRDIIVEGQDREDLMVRWLGEILYLFNGEKLIATAIEITSINSAMLKSRLTLSRFEPAIHHVRREIKAVTFHQISVERAQQGWEARIIFDI